MQRWPCDEVLETSFNIRSTRKAWSIISFILARDTIHSRARQKRAKAFQKKEVLNITRRREEPWSTMLRLTNCPKRVCDDDEEVAERHEQEKWWWRRIGDFAINTYLFDIKKLLSRRCCGALHSFRLVVPVVLEMLWGFPFISLLSTD